MSKINSSTFRLVGNLVAPFTSFESVNTDGKTKSHMYFGKVAVNVRGYKTKFFEISIFEDSYLEDGDNLEFKELSNIEKGSLLEVVGDLGLREILTNNEKYPKKSVPSLVVTSIWVR